MPWKSSVSVSVIRRLPRYYRFLGELLANGVDRISSRELSEKMGLTASQIRQDLNCFGGFGQQGYGYHVPLLRDEIARILGLHQQRKMIQIGLGHLGRAILSHLDFQACGFELIGLFEKKPDVIGKTLRRQIIHHIDNLEEFCKKYSPSAAILCVPKHSAEQVSRSLVEGGVRTFWNFSHYDLALHYSGIVVENVHLNDSLMTLKYLSHAQELEK